MGMEDYDPTTPRVEGEPNQESGEANEVEQAQEIIKKMVEKNPDVSNEEIAAALTEIPKFAQELTEEWNKTAEAGKEQKLALLYTAYRVGNALHNFKEETKGLGAQGHLMGVPFTRESMPFLNG
jgi:hypothetical protein